MAGNKQINSAQFINALRNNNLQELSRFGEFTLVVTEEITIDPEIVNWDYREVLNVLFNQKVLFRNVDLNSGFVFIGCSFLNGLIFDSVKSLNYQSALNEFGSSITISNCKGIYIQIKGENELTRSIQIGKGSEFEEINLSGILIYKDSIILNEAKITRLLEFDRCKSEINLYNSELEGTFRIENVIGNISVVNSRISKAMKVWNVECQNSFSLNGNEILGEFFIHGSRINEFYSHKDKFLRKAKYENRSRPKTNVKTHLNKIYISESEFIEGFEFEGLGAKLNELAIPISPNFKGVLKFIGWKINETHISGINEHLKLIFTRTKFKRLFFLDFSNSSHLAFESCLAENEDFKIKDDMESSIIATNSSLGHTRFVEFDFNSFNFLRFINVSFDGIQASNVTWFDDHKLQISPEKDETERTYRKRREIYRQIKQSLKTSGNQIDSLIFQAREMKTFHNEKKASEKYSFGDRIIMMVNWSNEYGLNWLRPVLIAMVLTFIFYVLMLPMFSKNICYCIKADFESGLLASEIIQNFDIFWQLFNPARKFTSTFGVVDSASLQFLDLLHRIFLGVIIFQIIKAFRKFALK